MKSKGDKPPSDADPDTGTGDATKLVSPSSDMTVGTEQNSSNVSSKKAQSADSASGKGRGKGNSGGGGSGGGGGRSGGGPSKSNPQAKENSSRFAQALQFAKEVLLEFRKISWPDRRQVFRETLSVLFLVAFITLLVLGFDWFLSKLVFGPLEHFARLHGGGVGRGF